MQNKGVIRLFAILFAFACLYQLSFTFVSGQVENDADEFANGDAVLKQRYLDSISSEPVYDILIAQYTFAEVKERELNLGLDLRGGMNVILEVQVQDILKELTNNSKHPVFTQAIQRANELAVESQDDYLANFFNAFDQVKSDQSVSVKLSDPAIFGTKEMNEKLGFDADDEAIKEEVRGDVDAAVENVYTVLRARIDQFGVVQPNIQRLENGGRILVELPGVKDPDRVKRLLQSTAELGFYELYDGVEMADFLSKAIDKIGTVELKDTANAGIDAPDADLLSIEAVDENPVSIEEGGDSTVAALLSGDGSIDSLLGESDSAVGPSVFSPFLRVFAPNIDENNRFNQGPIIGYARIQDTAKVNEYFSDPRIRNLLTGERRYTKFFWAAKPTEQNILFLFAAKSNRDGDAALTGDVIIDARQDFNQANQPVVSMSMNTQGATKWQKITRDASSQEPKKSVGVVLDDYVYSFPTVNGEIPTGNTQIVGSFTVQEAQDLANKLKAGKLPVAAQIIQADIVGPSLGKEAISSGLWSFVIALAIVLVYMIFYYSSAGIASDIALVVNMFFIFGVLASLGAVLTLPGIAGIVLTIGMAVDANVLIYERIREELFHGKGLKLAIKDGYNNAYSSIIDANVTTFLTGVILYIFGTGPIRGFATTLIIGILTSLFCAIFVTRLIFEARLDRKKVIHFSTKFTKGAFKNIHIDFLGKRKIAYGISLVIIIAGVVSLSTRGLNFGVDFVGGRSYQVRFDQPVSSVDIQNKLGDFFIADDGTKVYPEVKTIGDDNQVVITTKFKVNETGPEVEDEIKSKLYDGVVGYYLEDPGYAGFSSEASGSADIGIVAERQVGPTIADDIKSSAIYAIGLSLIFIFLYILIRFSKWQFSLGAVAAAFHDVLVVLAMFSIFYGVLPFSLEIDQAFIAAVLTVIGYSLNDTVVVFDRIREYLRTHSKRKEMNVVVNEALNSTLSRTVNTSLTTFFVLLVIFLFGGEVIRGFMFALLIGVVVGTYSSLFIATPLMMDTSKKQLVTERSGAAKPEGQTT